MKFLPIFLDVVDRPCLVVGGGEVAAQKVKQLLNAEGRVRVLAPDLCPALHELLTEGHIDQITSELSTDLLADCVVVIAATDDPAVNEKVSSLAQSRRIPVNVVDNPELCSFIMPSVVNRDPVQIAISTGGASPVLARLLRARLETMIPAAYGRLAELMREFRDEVKRRFPTTQETGFSRTPSRRLHWDP